MFQEISSFVGKITTGEIDQQSVSDAANEQVNTMPSQEVTQHVQTAAQNAEQNGQPDIAQQLVQLIGSSESDPQALKQGIISMISSNPQILQHFAPEFAQRIMGSL